MNLALAFTHQRGRHLVEISFLLVLFAGVWLAAAQIPQLKLGTAKTIIAGIALAIAGLLLIIATHWVISANRRRASATVAATRELRTPCAALPAASSTQGSPRPSRDERLGDDRPRDLLCKESTTPAFVLPVPAELTPPLRPFER
jgi:hypothetical protein